MILNNANCSSGGKLINSPPPPVQAARARSLISTACRLIATDSAVASLSRIARKTAGRESYHFLADFDRYEGSRLAGLGDVLGDVLEGKGIENGNAGKCAVDDVVL